MQSRKANIIVFGIIVATTLLSAAFIYPSGFGAKHLPWRLGLDLVGGSALIYEADLTGIPPEEHQSAVNGLKEVIERRVNIFGVAEPRVSIAQKGDTYQLLVDLAGVDNIEDAINQIGTTPHLEFRELATDVTEGEDITYVPTQLTGRHIQKASLGFDNLNNPLVVFQFNDEGAKLFEEITGRNIGRPLAIFLDGELTDSPTVRQKITGGNAQITGGGAGFTVPEARALVERFNAGALSAPIELINQRTVSASAAGGALKDVIFAAAIGTALVMAFMILYYRINGVYASIALAIYTILTLALFKVIPNFTMTLSGVAGFVLSIGMAVDANILIFERTKEEIKRGVEHSEAINEGFKRAWSSIRDSNTSTILTAIILYFFTSSFVRGFALTLGLGVLTSMLSSIFVTRTLLKVFSKAHNPANK